MAKRQDLSHQLRFVSSRVACDVLGVTSQTLRRWAKTGRIPAIKTPGGHYRYDLSGLIVAPTPVRDSSRHVTPVRDTPKQAKRAEPKPAQLDLVEMVKAVPAPAVISAEALRGQIERLAKSSSW
jgi:excisionase family DNA binding protein